MNILFLAPHPFYQNRGTPIAVDLLLKALSERGDQVDLVTYHEGKTLEYDNVTIHRIFNIPFIRNIRPGFSWKKLVCDFIMFFKVIQLAGRKHYQVVHSVEESVFMAIILKLLFRIPYIYDMDSSLSQQMVEKHPLTKTLRPLLEYLERIAIKNCEAAVPVCDSLAEIAEKYNPKKVVILHDVSLLGDFPKQDQSSLRKELRLGDSVILMYVGNLEAYQGIDLLIESFALTLEDISNAELVIIGGVDADIENYRRKSQELRISDKVHFLGSKPVENLAEYLSQADILVSPRIKGNNTPMKIYSYLHSGRAVLATDLTTHTQVLNNQVAMLADPSPAAFSHPMIRLIEDENLRLELGKAGKKLIEDEYSCVVFSEKVNALFDWVEKEVN